MLSELLFPQKRESRMLILLNFYFGKNNFSEKINASINQRR